MNEEGYKKLKRGSIVKNIKTQAIYVVMENKDNIEPCTQIRKEQLTERIKEFEIIKI